MSRFIPQCRVAADGVPWACVYDTKLKQFSNHLCFGKYMTKKECQFYIDWYTKKWGLEGE